jgi:hypothetical protein
LKIKVWIVIKGSISFFMVSALACIKEDHNRVHTSGIIISILKRFLRIRIVYDRFEFYNIV